MGACRCGRLSDFHCVLCKQEICARHAAQTKVGAQFAPFVCSWCRIHHGDALVEQIKKNVPNA